MSWFAPFHDLLREHDDEGANVLLMASERNENQRKKVEKKKKGKKNMVERNQEINKNCYPYNRG